MTWKDNKVHENRGVKHWVLSNCIQRGRSQGHLLGCAEAISMINCQDCLNELNECRMNWLQVREKRIKVVDDRMWQLEMEFQALAQQFKAAQALLKEHNIDLPVPKLTLHNQRDACPRCMKGMLMKKKGPHSIYYGCNQAPNCRYMTLVELVIK